MLMNVMFIKKNVFWLFFSQRDTLIVLIFSCFALSFRILIVPIFWTASRVD